MQHQARMDRLPSLNAVRYFEVAARLQSFTAAAAELHVTQGAVSRMIQTLEEQLGVRLFERNGRWIALTPAGKAYQRQVTAGLRQIADASHRLREGARSATLTLSVNVGFGTLWLVPNMPDFRARFPDIQVDVQPDDRYEAPDDPRVQAGIRYGSPPWPGHQSVRLLGHAEVIVVCSPRFGRRAEVHEPADLLAGPLLSMAGDRADPWQHYFEHFGLRMPDLGKSPRFLQLPMMREAAIAGLGFALVPLILFRQDLVEGRLVQAIPHGCAMPHGYHLLHRRGEDLDPKVRTFKTWLLGRLRDEWDRSPPARARRASA